MNKTNIVVLSVISVLVVAGVVGGFLVLHKGSSKVNDGQASISAANTSQTTPEQSSTLGVSTNATDLGQINPNQSKQSASGSGSSGGNSSGSDPVDPSTFKQYEKYHSATSAMFAEIAAGNGKALGANDKAVVVYKGWLTDGTLFDQSRTGSDGKLQAFSFVEGSHQVIPGWEQALYGMKAGGTRLLIVPSAVGYGAKGQGPVPADAMMIFEVQLVAVQ